MGAGCPRPGLIPLQAVTPPPLPATCLSGAPGPTPRPRAPVPSSAHLCVWHPPASGPWAPPRPPPLRVYSAPSSGLSTPRCPGAVSMSGRLSRPGCRLSGSRPVCGPRLLPRWGLSRLARRPPLWRCLYRVPRGVSAHSEGPAGEGAGVQVWPPRAHFEGNGQGAGPDTWPGMGFLPPLAPARDPSPSRSQQGACFLQGQG